MHIAEGSTHSAAYPFCRDTAYLPDEDGMAEVPTWRPGTRNEHIDDDFWIAADAMGEMLLTVVGVYKPGRFPTRVFYTRQWKDPEGKVFGKGKLHITTQQHFRSLLRGYRHEYHLEDGPVALGRLALNVARAAIAKATGKEGA